MCLDIKTNVRKPIAMDSNMENMMDTDNDSDSLKIKRLTGGSLIDYPPLISPDGEVIHVIWNNFVQTYSTSTGEWLRDLEGLNEPIIGLAYDNENSKILLGCTVSGNILRWKWKSGVSEKSKNALKFSIQPHRIKTFNIIKNTCLIIYETKSKYEMEIFDLDSGNSNEHLDLLASDSNDNIRVSTGGYSGDMIAVIKNCSIFFSYMQKKNRLYKESRNLNNIEFTCLTCHPTQDLVLTGDTLGRICIWRDIQKELVKAIYHWHSTPVNCIALSQSGTHFYSGANESVLVKWSLDNSDKREYLPRMSSSIMHITIGSDNARMTVATSDNGIQILNPHMRQIAIIQNFTRVELNDRNLQKPYPCGLKLNPRRNSIVLNSRVGHLQLYSTHTKSLLYNLDISLQNTLSMEREKEIYNTKITNVAMNTDWMATGECWNDMQNTTESRLKFWYFDEQKQTFSLNTNIELPHDKGIIGLEFSTVYSSKNLICASAGLDHIVKLWSLDDSNTIYNKGKHWMCFGKISYKNLPILSIAFSQDGSILSAGFGNVLTVWKSDTLNLKCALSAPSGVDGSINKLSLSLPQKTKSTTDDKQKYMERRKIMFEKMQKLLENRDKNILKEITKDKSRLYQSEVPDKSQPLSSNDRKMIFKRIMLLNEVNLIQKLEIFKNLGIYCKVAALNSQICTFLEYSISEKLNIGNTEKLLDKRIKKLSYGKQYLAKRKFKNYQNRKDQTREKSRLLTNLLNFATNGIPSKQLNGSIVNGKIKTNTNNENSPLLEECSKTQIKKLVQINHINFGTGEFSHLVIVCTENRLLVWNLLTLRLQTALKLSARHIVIDPLTNLIAIFTTRNNLYVFLPNVPIPLYSRQNVSNIHGCVWVPRIYPKQCSITVDWQAISQLYFLNENQELLYLVSDDDEEAALPVAFIGDIQKELTYSTPFAAMLSKKIENKVTDNWSNTNRIGVLGRANIKELIGYACHTMPPASLLCSGFLKSLVIENPETFRSSSNEENDVTQNGDDEDDDRNDEDDDEQLSELVLRRKSKLNALEKSVMKQQKSVTEEQQLNVKLKQLSLEMFNDLNII